MSKEPELKPCPFCGQQDAFVEQLDSDASVVICQGMVDEHCACLARGPVGVQQSDDEDQPGHDAAILEWNARQPAPDAQGLVAFAVSRWHDEVAKRPLVNVYRRTLDATWRQVLRFAGEDDVVLLGPRHDDMLDASGNPLPEYAASHKGEQP